MIIRSAKASGSSGRAVSRSAFIVRFIKEFSSEAEMPSACTSREERSSLSSSVSVMVLFLGARFFSSIIMIISEAHSFFKRI